MFLTLNLEKWTLLAVLLLIGSLPPLSLRASELSGSRAAAVIDNQIITMDQVDESLKNQLYEAEQKIYELKLNKLKSLLLERLIKDHPFSRGMSSEDFLDKFVIKEIKISALDVEQFIAANRVPAEKINEKFKKDVKSYMIKEKQREKVSAWFAQQSKEHGVVINLKKPDRPKIEIPINGAPVWGNKDAKVTIVEYSDFQCPFCAKAEVTVKELQKKYAGKIKFVYKQFPLGFHKNAFKASEASLCANEQSNELFWKLHEQMFNNIKDLSVVSLKAKAKKIGVKELQFSQCLDSGKYAAKVNQEIAEGKSYGVQATPMFFVNGVTVRGAQPYSVFEKLIEEELAR